MTKNRKWLRALSEFIKHLRIDSKEITAADSGGVKLVLWDSQRLFLENVADGLDDGVRMFYCLKSRQLGISTISLCIDVFWLAMHPGIIGALVTDSEANRDSFRATLQRYVKSIPDSYRGKGFQIQKNNRSMMTFSNGSRIDFLVAGTKKKANWGEGRGYAFVHATEVSKYGDAEGLRNFEESFATNNPDRLFLYESTANGMNHWYDKYLEGHEETTTKRAFFIGWWAHPFNRISRDDPRFEANISAPISKDERDRIKLVKERHNHLITEEQLAWYRWRSNERGMTEQTMRQNQPWTDSEAFVLSGFSFFAIRTIQEDLARCAGNDEHDGVEYQGYRYIIGEDFFAVQCEKIVDEERRREIELRVWHEPVEGAQYVIGCDPAFGRNDWKDRHCLDSETELLTRDGWKRYEQITKFDDAVCFDTKTGTYSYGRVQDIIIRDHDGPMFHFTSDGMDCLVTPEHRMVSRWWSKLRDGRNSPWDVKTAVVTAAAAKKSTRAVPIGGAPIGNGIAGLSLDMCRALGWIMTEGHARRSSGPKSRRTIVVAQSTATVKDGINIAEEMDRVFTRLSTFARHEITEPKEHPAKIVWRFRVEEAEIFLKWLGEDIHALPRRILTEASREQLEAVFRGLLEGDGSWDKKQKTWVKFCPGGHTPLADGFQELALRLGYSATRVVQKAQETNHKDQWLIRLSTRSSHCIRKQPAYETHYAGPVWDITVPTGAFVARRNGKAFVTGNCVSVWRCFGDRLVQCAEYATSSVETRQAAWVLAHLAGAYRDCIVSVELSGGPGRVVMTEFTHMREMVRAEIYNQKRADLGWEDFLSNARWYLYHRPDSMASGYAYNFETTGRTKTEIMNQMRDSYSTRQMVINSVPLLNEMAIVTQDDGRIGAPESSGENSKDDRVFAAALANRAWINWLKMEMIQRGYLHDLVMNTESGATPPPEPVVAKLVADYFRRMEDISAAGPQPPKWMRDRGLA